MVRAQLFVTPWAPLSMEFSRQGYWSGLPFPSPEDLPNPGIKPGRCIFHRCHLQLGTADSLFSFLAVNGRHCCAGFSLVLACGLLTAVASVVTEHGL